MERIEGVNYFDHQFLLREDFSQARVHHVNRLRQHNHVAHTSGIVGDGLVVSIVNPQRIAISNGRGIDRHDRETVLSPAVVAEVELQMPGGEPRRETYPPVSGTGIEVDLSPALRPAQRDLFVKVRAIERKTGRRVDPGVEDDARLEERPRFVIDDEPFREGDPYLVLGRLEFDDNGRLEDVVTADVRSEPAGSVIGDDAIQQRHLAPNSVGTEQLQDNAVTSTELDADAVLSAHIAEADNASAQDTNDGRGVKTAHLADGAVTGAKIAGGTITQGNMAEDSIGRLQLLDGAVGPAELGERAVESLRLAEADNLSAQNTGSGRGVKTAHLADGAVTGAKIAGATIAQEHLASDAVGSPQLRADAVVSAKLAEADNVSGQDTDTGSGVKTGHLANEAVTRAKLATGVRDALAAGYLLFDPFDDVVVSQYNVEAVKHSATGRYQIRWQDPIRGTRTLPDRLLGGVRLTEELERVLRREPVGDAPTLLGDALRAALERDPGRLPRASLAPRTPDYLVATDNVAGTIVLQWTPSLPTSDPVAGYELRRDGELRARTEATAYSDSVEPGRRYTYEIVALDVTGAPSAPRALEVEAAPAPPAAPAIVALEAAEPGVKLAWEHPGADHYELQRDGVLIATTREREHHDEEPVLNAVYTYVVKAVAESGESAESPPSTISLLDTTPPGRPRNLLADVYAPGIVGLGWDAASDDTGVRGYEIYRDGERIGLVEHPDRFFADLSAPRGDGAAIYSVAAVDAAGNVSPVARQEVRLVPAQPPQPAPKPPVELTVQRREGGVEVSWVAGPTAAAMYLVARNGEYFTAYAPDPVPESHGLIDDNAPTGRLVEYRVAVVDRAGQIAVTEPAFVTIPDTRPPTPPQHFAATFVGTTTVELAATAARDDVGVAEYRLARDGVGIARILPPDGPALRVADTAAPEVRTVRYRLTAFDAAGNESEPVETVVETRDATAPQPPERPSATVTDEGIRLAWPPAVDNVGVTGYRVHRDGLPILTVTSLEAVDARVVAGASYTYAIAAVDAAGNRSALSAPLSVATVDDVPPGPPPGVTAEALSPYVVRVRWEAAEDNVGVTGYEIDRDDRPAGTVAGGALEFADTHASPGVRHVYQVRAVDAAGNVSAPSDAVEVTMPPDDVGDIGPVFAYAFLPAAERLVHVVAITAQELELSVVDPRAGTEADAFLSVVAFEATAPAGRIVPLDELLRRPAPDVLGGALGRLTPAELRVIVGRLPGAGLDQLLPSVPDDRVGDVAGVLDPAVLGPALTRLPREQRDRLLASAPPPVFAALLAHVPRDELAETVGALEDERLAGVLANASPVVLGDLVAASSGAGLERIVRGAPAGTLGDALVRVERDKAREALDILSRERLREVVLSASAGAAGTLAGTAASDRLAGAVAGANVGERRRLLAIMPEGTLAEVLAVAGGRELERIVPGVDGARLAGALRAAEDTGAVAEVLPPDILAGAILSTDPGVAATLPEATLARVLSHAEEADRSALIARLDDDRLAAAVAATEADARPDLVRDLPTERLVGALGPAATRGEVVAAASDEQLAQVLVSADTAKAASLAAEIPAERAAAIVDAAPAARRDRVRELLGGGRRA